MLCSCVPNKCTRSVWCDVVNLSTQSQTVAAEGEGEGEGGGGEPVSELSIMQKLLMPAAEVLAMDATDSSCGDRLLKGMGKEVREGQVKSTCAPAFVVFGNIVCTTCVLHLVYLIGTAVAC